MDPTYTHPTSLDVVGRYLAALTEADSDGMDACRAPDYVLDLVQGDAFDQDALSHEETRAFWPSWFASFPEMDYEVTRTIAAETVVVSQWVFTGTNSGPLSAPVFGQDMESTGKTVRLRFVSDCGPNDNSTTDHSQWGDVWVLGREGRRAVAEPIRHMTFLDAEPFTSTFYFSAIRSPQVDLEFVVEGSEPVWLEGVTAHTHPDAMARVFEHGLVAANPSPRPCALGLANLAPGRSFRRLQGSSRQDPRTNNGQPVVGPLTLGPKDALFVAEAER